MTIESALGTLVVMIAAAIWTLFRKPPPRKPPTLPPDIDGDA